MKIRFPICLIILLGLSSCAVMELDNYCSLYVSSAEQGTQLSTQDSIYALPATIELKRSEKDLPISLISDTVCKDYLLKPMLTDEFKYGNLAFLYLAPIGYVIDFGSNKSFYFGDSLHLSFEDTVFRIKAKELNVWDKIWLDKFPTNKHLFRFTATLPVANNFYFAPLNEEVKSISGYLGLSVGMEYHYQTKKYISLKGAAYGANPILAPIGVDHWGEWESVNSVSFSLCDNYEYGRCSFGYGICYAFNNYMHESDWDEQLLTTHYTKKKNVSLGLNLDTYYQFSKHVFIGIVYRPSIYRVKPTNGFIYEHVLSLNLSIKSSLKELL